MRPTGSGLVAFNELPTPDAWAVLRTCCAARRWVEEITSLRPFNGQGLLLIASDRTVERFGPPDVDEALAGHRRTGETAAGGSRPGSGQDGLSKADAEVRRRIAEARRIYEERFGRIYVVCASGRSGRELLAILTTRLENDPMTEYSVTKSELSKINRIGLVRMLERLAADPQTQSSS